MKYASQPPLECLCTVCIVCIHTRASKPFLTLRACGREAARPILARMYVKCCGGGGNNHTNQRERPWSWGDCGGEETAAPYVEEIEEEWNGRRPRPTAWRILTGSVQQKLTCPQNHNVEVTPCYFPLLLLCVAPPTFIQKPYKFTFFVTSTVSGISNIFGLTLNENVNYLWVTRVTKRFYCLVVWLL